jgi:hypothetical protein
MSVLELSIERSDLALRNGYVAPVESGEGVVLLAEILGQMAEARAAGIRTLLLNVDSVGGDAFTGLPVTQAQATGKYAYHRWVQGDEPEGGPAETAWGLLYGRKRPGRISELAHNLLDEGE